MFYRRFLFHFHCKEHLLHIDDQYLLDLHRGNNELTSSSSESSFIDSSLISRCIMDGEDFGETFEVDIFGMRKGEELFFTSLQLFPLYEDMFSPTSFAAC